MNMDEAGWKSEIHKALEWWRECFKTATNVDVHFRVLGEEVPALFFIDDPTRFDPR